MVPPEHDGRDARDVAIEAARTLVESVCAILRDGVGGGWAGAAPLGELWVLAEPALDRVHDGLVPHDSGTGPRRHTEFDLDVIEAAANVLYALTRLLERELERDDTTGRYRDYLYAVTTLLRLAAERIDGAFALGMCVTVTSSFATIDLEPTR